MYSKVTAVFFNIIFIKYNAFIVCIACSLKMRNFIEYYTKDFVSKRGERCLMYLSH